MNTPSGGIHSGDEHNFTKSMTMLQLAIRLSYVGEGIDAGNRDFQFSPLDTLGEFSQDLGTGSSSVPLGLDTILLDSLKIDDGVNA